MAPQPHFMGALAAEAHVMLSCIESTHHGDLPLASTRRQQKSQKNFRLTVECQDLLALLAMGKGINESAVIEMLVRDEAIRLNLRGNAAAPSPK